MLYHTPLQKCIIMPLAIMPLGTVNLSLAFSLLARHSLSACKVWGDQATCSSCKCEIWCFLYVTLGLPARGGHSSNKYCATVYGSILMQFSAPFFQNGFFSQMHYTVVFVARWCHNVRVIAVKNCEKSKNWRKSLSTPLCRAEIN